MLTGTATATRVVDRRQQERLRAAARLARHANRVLAHVRQRLEEVEAADAVPELQAGQAQAPQVLAPAAEGVRELPAVVVADHVVDEDDEALAREVDGAARARA